MTEPAGAGADGAFDAHPRKPRIWHLILLWAVSLSAAFVPYIVVVARVFADNPGLLEDSARRDKLLEEALLRPSVILSSLAAVVLANVAFALAAGRIGSPGLAARLSLGRGRARAAEIFLACLGTLALSAAFAILLRFLPSFSDSSVEKIMQFVRDQTGASWWAFLVLSALIGPVGEELFYRGAIQTRFVERFGAARGIVLASSLFAIAHFDPIHSTFAFATGLYLGWLAWIAGSIRISVVAHAVNNSFSVLGASALPTASGDSPLALPAGLAWLTAAIALAFTVRRLVRRRDPAA